MKKMSKIVLFTNGKWRAPRWMKNEEKNDQSLKNVENDPSANCRKKKQEILSLFFLSEWIFTCSEYRNRMHCFPFVCLFVLYEKNDGILIEKQNKNSIQMPMLFSIFLNIIRFHFTMIVAIKWFTIIFCLLT